MKKLLVCAAIAVFGMSSVFAQEFNVGLSAALPMGDAGDFTTFGVNLDANYLWDVSDDFKAGVTTGYHHYFGDEVTTSVFGTSLTLEFDDFGFLPIAAAGRYNVSEVLTVGADLGYAVGLSPDGNEGGVYYAPKIQYSVSDKIDIVAAYKGISNDGSFDSVSLGVEFGL
ncbi:hypothetical protein [Lacinutrix jangbogonensis]|uniref:hypothetical protein n=1 Tax=Lacinutrix jangbogonensis TaxID=1469557 RepID=UPI00053ED280|nr:hypothetical protein [Lacinutrix jangbogonensis]